MNPNYLYLTIDLAAISVPFIFSFYHKANFSKKWKFLWPALLLSATFFLVWDEWFTSMGIWCFNEKYITGIYFFSLPMEEILFFICIPYACVFTYEAVGYFSKRDYLLPYTSRVTNTLIAMLLLIGLINLDKWYTSVTFILCASWLSYLHFKLKSDFLGKFYLSFLFILIPFFIVNGILTGTGIESPVVWYNDAENLGIRMGTIPIEDTFYGMFLILMNISVFELLQRNRPRPNKI